MYRYDEFDAAFVEERVGQFRDQVARRVAGEWHGAMPHVGREQHQSTRPRRNRDARRKSRTKVIARLSKLKPALFSHRVGSAVRHGDVVCRADPARWVNVIEMIAGAGDSRGP